MNRYLGDLQPSLWITMLAALLAACGAGSGEAVSPRALNVVTQSLTRAAGYEGQRVYTGRVEAASDSDVGFEIGGLLAQVSVDEGETVKAGQILARLDTARLAARRAELTAALEEVRARLALAKATLERTEDALSYKGVSKQQYDEAQEGVRALSAAAGVAAARVETLDVDLAKAVLKAPFDAAVIRRMADPGEVLAPGQALLQLQTVSAPELRLALAADAANDIEIGGRYAVEIGAVSLSGVVKAVVPRRDDVTRTVDVLLTLADAPDRVRPGDLGRLSLSSRYEEAGFWVPLGALTQGPRGLWNNYVAEPIEDPGFDATAHRVAPRTVEVVYADSDRAFVRGTLRDGDLLIVDGLQRVVPGQTVAVINGPLDSGVKVAGEHSEGSAP